MSDVKTIFHGSGDSLTIERKQDVEGILKSNQEDQSVDQNPHAFGRRVASIPNIVIEQWMKEGLNIFDMHKDPSVRRKIMMKLNSPEWRHLRTHNSRL